ncbi:hypothetical protein Busp01_46940 [Trinickia caryophylli]|nr:hypothetical protein Busp01_46940 [Trinickia caryophylli]
MSATSPAAAPNIAGNGATPNGPARANAQAIAARNPAATRAFGTRLQRQSETATATAHDANNTLPSDIGVKENPARE